jgi:antiviral helicase SLH1
MLKPIFRVPLKTGLFFFDSSFRPVPLEQHFIGIKGKPGTQASRRNMDKVTFRKVKQLVAEGHQVMIFVHSRRDTVKTAETMKELAATDGCLDDFDGAEHPQYAIFRRELGTSKNKEMKLLFDAGFGIHHAGMLRSDRNMMERMFGARAIKVRYCTLSVRAQLIDDQVLCCTATLAWGVNLPAHAGTAIQDSDCQVYPAYGFASPSRHQGNTGL